jgi:beta-lactamase superfamily II metal-dependent hydrolase
MKKIYIIRVISIILILLFSSISLASCKNPPKNEQEPKFTPCEIDILKVGKADCIVINTGTQIVMIDTAEEENFSTVKSYMEKRGYSRIDTLILTHYDKDHIGGAAQILSSYDVKNVVENRFAVNSIYYNAYHSIIENKGINLINLHSYEYNNKNVNLTNLIKFYIYTGGQYFYVKT